MDEMDEMTNQVMDQTAKVLKRGLEIVENAIPGYAKLARLYFTSLVKEGFTEDQALRIVCSQSVMPNSGKSA